MVKNLPAMQETWVWSLGWEDPLEKEGLPTLVYYGLENSMDRVAWQATVHGVAKNRTQLTNFHTSVLIAIFSLLAYRNFYSWSHFHDNSTPRSPKPMNNLDLWGLDLKLDLTITILIYKNRFSNQAVEMESCFGIFNVLVFIGVTWPGHNKTAN